MISLTNLKNIFIFSCKKNIKNITTKIFFFSLLIPVIILVLSIILSNIRYKNINYLTIFYDSLLPAYFLIFIPIGAILFGTSIINEDLSDKTYCYIVAMPIPKLSYLLGKLLSSLLFQAVIVFISLSFSYFTIVHNVGAFSLNLYSMMIISMILSIFVYTSLFMLFSILFKNPLVPSLIYIFFWESYAHFFPGFIQKLTVIHYIKSIIPYNLSNNKSFFVVNLQKTSSNFSIIILSSITILLFMIGYKLLCKKEFLLD